MNLQRKHFVSMCVSVRELETDQLNDPPWSCYSMRQMVSKHVTLSVITTNLQIPSHTHICAFRNNKYWSFGYPANIHVIPWRKTARISSRFCIPHSVQFSNLRLDRYSNWLRNEKPNQKIRSNSIEASKTTLLTWAGWCNLSYLTCGLSQKWCC